MSVEGRCGICQAGSVEHRCERCGALVCDRHWDESTGYCVECSAEVGGGTSDRHDDSGGPDGTDTYRF